MRNGHKRDAEIDAMCDFCHWLTIATAKHQDDVELANFARRCRLITLRELMADMAALENANFIQDRMSDCKDCDLEGGRTCLDGSGHWHGCKWRNGKNKVAFVGRWFGDTATQYLKKYSDVRTNGRA